MSHKHDERQEKRHREKIEREKQREEEWEKQPRTIHPAWFLALGIALIIMVVLTWTLLLS
jgi:hypothetical protein